jgi:hypothetical protein
MYTSVTQHFSVSSFITGSHCSSPSQQIFKDALPLTTVGTLEAVANSKIETLPLRSVQSNRGEKT